MVADDSQYLEYERRPRRRRPLLIALVVFLVAATVGLLALTRISSAVRAYRAAAEHNRESVNNARAARTAVLVRDTEYAIAQYRHGAGSCPAGTEADVLRALPSNSIQALGRFGEGGFDVRRMQVLDAWGHALRIPNSPEGPMVYSVGPDGRDDGGQGDDIRWDSGERQNASATTVPTS